MRPISKIVIHHSITPRDLSLEKTVTSIDRNHALRLHKSRNGLGLHVAYHYLISGEGEVRATRPESEIGYHASNWYVNMRSLGICLLGNFDSEEPTVAQWNALDELVAKLRKKYGIKAQNVTGHRSHSNKSCPGRNISDKELGEIALGIREIVPVTNEPSEWAAAVWEEAKGKGIITDNPQGELLLRDLEIILHRLGGVNSVTGKISRERFLVALSKLGVQFNNVIL